MKKVFPEIVNSFQSLLFSSKSSINDIWKSPKYVYEAYETYYLWESVIFHFSFDFNQHQKIVKTPFIWRKKLASYWWHVKLSDQEHLHQINIYWYRWLYQKICMHYFFSL